MNIPENNHMITEKSTIHFSLPEQFGVTMYIDGVEYMLFAEEGRICDAALTMFSQDCPKQLVFYDAPEAEERKTVCMSFSPEGMLIETRHSSRVFNITYDDFKSALLAHMKKHAIYFVAPYNYQAIMLLPFDEMVLRMKKGQPEADALVERINGMK